jgi:hypothetical protein
VELHEARIFLPNRFTKWRLHPLGDLHVGAAAFDKKAFEAKVKEIAADPHSYWIGMGDYIDAVGHLDPRFDPRDIDPTTKVRDLDDLFAWQANAFLRLVEPIKSKCLGLLTGNHEESVRLHSIQDPARSIAEWMGVPDLRYAASIRIHVFDKESLKGRGCRYLIIVYCHHGWGGGRTEGSKVNKARDQTSDMAPANADIVMVGHIHSEAVGKKVWLRVTERGPVALVPGERVWVLTGSYRKNWVRGATTYSERKGLPMVVIGSPHVEITRKCEDCETTHGRDVEYEVTKFRVVGS